MSISVLSGGDSRSDGFEVDLTAPTRAAEGVNVAVITGVLDRTGTDPATSAW